MGVAKKTTFSIADSADSWVTISRDLIEYSGSGIVNISITPIFSQNNQFNINGYLLRFISGYLKDRNQRVKLENSFSTFKPVNSGVPQGSILGPLLFLLFINDISDGLDPKTNISQYADDTKLWRAMNSERDCEILQSDVDKLSNWCRVNKMKLHPDKCKVMSIKATSKNDGNLLYTLPFANFSYIIGNIVISYENSEKDLGVIVNDEFT